MGRLAKYVLLGLVLCGFAGGTHAEGLLPGTGEPGTSTRVPTTGPSNGTQNDELEGRPGRDDPDEFYKKPPRKPRQRKKLHACADQRPGRTAT